MDMDELFAELQAAVADTMAKQQAFDDATQAAADAGAEYDAALGRTAELKSKLGAQMESAFTAASRRQNEDNARPRVS